MAMQLHPPAGYVTIHDALMRTSGNVSLIGIVSDFFPPRQTSGTDFVITFHLWDPSCGDPKGLTVRAFKKPEYLPQVQTIGDIVLLKNVKMQTKGYGLMGLFSWSTTALVFPKEKLPDYQARDEVANGLRDLLHWTSTSDFTPSKEHQLYIMDLLGAQADPMFSIAEVTGLTVAPVKIDPSISSTPSPNVQKITPLRSQQIQPSHVKKTNLGNTKFLLLKDLAYDVYADLVVEIVKVYANSMSDTVDFYVTDYTKNNQFFLYLRPEEERELHGDERELDDFGITSTGNGKGWKGPFGQYTLCVTLYSPHSDAAIRDFREGDICFLKNIRTRLSREGKLEARLSQDNRNVNQVNVRSIPTTDPLVQELQTRKEEYELQQNKVVPPKKNNKNNRQGRIARKAREAEERRQLEAGEAARDQKSLSKAQPIDSAEAASTTAKQSSNAHIVAAHPSQPLTPLSEIIHRGHLNTLHNSESISLPFVNARYRTRLRVVDFWPSNLADFSHCINDTQYNPMLPGDSDDEDWSPPHFNSQSLSQQESRKWEWAFVLLVEDALSSPQGPRNTNDPSGEKGDRGTQSNGVQLMVSNDAAQFLLGIDAVDLRQDSKALAQLREKMFLVWGDLEEVKENSEDGFVSPKDVKQEPFECCVAEYGVRDPTESLGWRRMWRMFETTVK